MSMPTEERDIVNYLQATPGAYYTGREIAKRAGGKRTFLRNPDWAKAILPNMVERRILEQDSAGHFRLTPPKRVEARGRKWVFPQIAKLLKKSGKDFGAEVVFDLEEEEDKKES